MEFSTVYHLGTNEKFTYSLEPREAVIAAHAQYNHDYNTWDYEKRYGNLPKKGRHGWHLGDFSAPFNA